ncbi:MAG: hypothetical protein AAFV88_02865 [Planctomycetota bacterium]
MIAQFFALIFGHAIAIGFFSMIWRRNSYRWRLLARQYAVDNRDDAPPITNVERRRLQNAILLGGGLPGWNSYLGITTVGVVPQGIVLELMLPFSIGYPALLLPFGDVEVTPRKWYLNCESVQYVMAKEPSVQIVFDEALQNWIEVRVAALSGSTAQSV